MLSGGTGPAYKHATGHLRAVPEPAEGHGQATEGESYLCPDTMWLTKGGAQPQVLQGQDSPTMAMAALGCSSFDSLAGSVIGPG